MATILSTPSAVHHIQIDIDTPEPAATSWEKADAAAESAILSAATVTIIGLVVLLGSISVWLWYGLHQYQNCL